MPFKGKRIGVVMGGLSSEREVSLNTGKGVHAALREKGHDAVAIDWRASDDLPVLLKNERVQVVWIALHGTHGEDGCVQGLLECLRIPYTGSGVTSSALAMDKVLSKRIFDDLHIPTPGWKVLGAGDDARALARPLGWPVVVKPSREGSTVGITIVKDESGLDAAIAIARKCHGETMVERYIPGREISVGILDDAVLGTVEIRTAADFYTYEAKYQRGDNEYLVPAPLPPSVDDLSRTAALRAYRALGCSGYARVDLRVDGEKAFVLEANTLPGMTGTSLLPKIAKHAGLDYPVLCERILASAGLHT